MNHLPLLFVILILPLRYIGKHHTKSPKLPSLSSAFLYGFFSGIGMKIFSVSWVHQWIPVSRKGVY